jgi:hypothetical protein
VTAHEREQHLFILRAWRERSSPDGAWRGSVKHVESGRTIVSADLDEVIDFIRVRLAPESDDAPVGQVR